MSIQRVAAVLCAVVLGAGTLEAQGLRNADQPAEFPPASYTGKQYIDSRGCVYIRAGIDGNVTWVPRVTRSRKVICGQKPTGVAGTTAAAAPRASGQKPVQIVPKTVPAQTAVAKPAPKPKTTTVRRTTTATAATAPTVIRRTAPPPRTTTVVRRQPVTQPAPRTTTTRRVVRRSNAVCPGLSATANRYIRNDPAYPVRCGPQATLQLQSAPGVRGSATNAVIVPEHLYQPPSVSQVPLRVPEGYKPAWEDDRLNARRAYQTLNGKQQMDLVWTKTIPRRLIDRKTGRDVTELYPHVAYRTKDTVVYVPAGTRVSTKSARVSTKSTPVKKVAKPTSFSAKSKKKVVKPATVSTKSVAPKKPKATKASYVQVGTFAQQANAQRTAQRLQRAGLPVRIGKLKRKGKEYRIVFAGPYASKADASRGLSTVRRAGFGDAFIR